MDILQKIDLALRNFDIDEFVHHPTQMIIEAEQFMSLMDETISDKELDHTIHVFVKKKVEQYKEHYRVWDANTPRCVICGTKNRYNEHVSMCDECLDAIKFDIHWDPDFDDFIEDQEQFVAEIDEDGCYEPIYKLTLFFGFK
jgi:hypothetical protein